MRKLSRRETMLLGLVGAGLLVLAVRLLLGTDAVPPNAAPTTSGPAAEAIARIDLARLDALPPPREAGRRNLFSFGMAERVETEAPVIVPTPPPITAPPAGSAAALGEATSTPSLPPLNVKYIGSVESAAGIKVAVLVTDRKEVLTGQAGQVVANRYRVARIGIESVDLEDVNTGQSRRIPLRVQ